LLSQMMLQMQTITLHAYCLLLLLLLIFFFNDTAPTEIYTLSLHDALPISRWLATQSLLALPDRRRDSLCPAQLLRSFRERRRPGVRLPAGHPQTWTAAQLLRRSRCRLHRPLAQADLCGIRYPTTQHAGPGL